MLKFILLLIPYILFGYQYQLGVYKNDPRYNEDIQKINPQNLIINLKNNLFYIKSKNYSTLNKLKKDRYIYERVFPDLYIIYNHNNNYNTKKVNLNIKKLNKATEKKPVFISDYIINNNNVKYYKNLIIKDKKDYEDRLKKIDPFLGIYFIGNIEQNNNNLNSSFRLEWKLFDNGYNQFKKALKKKKNESIIQYYQLLIDMKNREISEFLYNVDLMKNYSRYVYNTKLKNIYIYLLEKREKLRNNGFNTDMNVNEIRNKIDIINDNINLYKISKSKKINLTMFSILNSIDYIQLKDKNYLLTNIFKTNLNLLIQDYFKNRSNFYETWNDNLKLNFYVQHNNSDFENSDNSIGVHFEIPIDVNTEREQLVKLEKNNYKNQKESIKIRLEEKLSSLYNQFYFQQNKIKILKKELKLLNYKLEVENYKAKNYIKSLKNNPLRTKELLKIKILENKQKILESRFILYKKLGKIYFLSNYKYIKDIIKSR